MIPDNDVIYIDFNNDRQIRKKDDHGSLVHVFNKIDMKSLSMHQT